MTDTPEDAKIKASALKVAIASKETRQSRFWQLTLGERAAARGAPRLAGRAHSATQTCCWARRAPRICDSR